MRLKTIFRRSVALVALTLIAALPQTSFAAAFGGVIGRALAETLGLAVAMVPDQLAVNVPLTIGVVNPDLLAKQGLTGLKVGDQVRVTLLADGQVSIVPILKALVTTTTQISSPTTIKSSAILSPTTTTTTTATTGGTTTALSQSLLLSIDAKGAITTKQLVPLTDTKLQLEAAPLIKR